MAGPKTGGSMVCGVAIRRAREAAGLTQETAANLIGRGRKWWLGVECGRTSPTLLELGAIAELLNVEVDVLLGRGAGKLDGEEDDTRRRTFLALLAGAFDLERLAAPIVDAAYLETAESVTTALLGRWYAAAPAVLLPPVLAHLRGLQQALPGPTELENLTGRTALLAGHLFDKVGRPPEARTHYALAESLARDTRDGDLLAVTLVLRSGLHSWRRTSDRRRGFGLVEEAAVTIGPGSPPLLRALVMARMAEERAAVADADGFLRDMDAAEAAVEPGRDHWYGPRDGAELAAVRGTCELLLGRHADAAQTLSWTLARMNPSAVNWRAVVAADRDRALAAL